MEIGELIKKLRKERQLTQEELSNGITTRTTLSSIENRNNTISLNLLIEILDRLNVRLEEFLFLLGKNETSEKQKLYLGVYTDFYTTGTLSEENERALLFNYKKTNDFYYLALYTQMLGINYRNKGVISSENKQQLEKNIDKIKKHLDTVTDWNHMELALFTNCLFLFDSNYIQAVYRRTVKKMAIRKKLRLYQEDIAIFLLNCIDLFLEREEDISVDYFLKELDKQLIRSNQIYEKTLMHFYRAILSIRQGKMQEKEKIQKILSYLSLIEEDEQVKTLRHDIKKYTGIVL